MFGQLPSQLLAVARVVGATPAATFAKGCSWAETSTGVHAFTLEFPVDEEECVQFVALETAAITAQCVSTSDAVKTVTTSNATPAAADATFQWACTKVIF